MQNLAEQNPIVSARQISCTGNHGIRLPDKMCYLMLSQFLIWKDFNQNINGPSAVTHTITETFNVQIPEPESVLGVVLVT